MKLADLLFVVIVAGLIAACIAFHSLLSVTPKGETNCSDDCHCHQQRDCDKNCDCHQPELLVFTAPWCSVCHADEPQIAKLEETHRIVRIDIDADPDSARKYDITAVPTFIVHPGASNELRTNDVEEVLAALKHEAQARNTAR